MKSMRLCGEAMTAPDRSESARDIACGIVSELQGEHSLCAKVSPMDCSLVNSIEQALLAAEERGEEKGWNKAIKQAALIGEQFEIQDEVSSRIRGLKFKSK